MKLKKLPLGLEDFTQLRTHDFYYVDKTGMIKELLENWGSVNLFMRPRRFGKSLNMSMIKTFFEIGTNEALFSDLAISKECDLCRQYMGKYPVISLTLKTVAGLDFTEAKDQLWSVIKAEAERFDYLQTSQRLNERDKQNMMNLSQGIGNLYESLALMSRILYREYGQKSIILIDEYDVPLQKAEQNGYYHEMTHLISQFFSNGMKTNSYMEFAVVTGCLKITKESIFTGFNNVVVHTIMDEQYDEWFGFTDQEVKKILQYYNLEKYYETTKKWYDGYRFGSADVYCPWDVISWCKQLMSTSDRTPGNYWSSTSSNDIILRFAEQADFQTKEQLGSLIEGKSILKKVNWDLTYHTIDHNIDNLWSVMLMTGYLTARSRNENSLYELSIPNREITCIFIDLINHWFTEKVLENHDGLKDFFHALNTDDPQALQRCLNSYMEESISFIDGGRISEKETFYHGLILGILNSRTDWIVRSNREAGDGRLDVVAYPKKGNYAVIFEFKYAKNENELDVVAQKALEQINQNQYDQYFGSLKPKKMIHYGIAFYKKHCKVAMECS